MMVSKPAPLKTAPLDEAAELPAGAALEATDAGADVAMGMEAELPADAAPLDIIIIDEEPPAIMEESAIIEELAIMEEAAIEEAAMDEPPPAAGPAEDAQAHTAWADVCTARPVWGPQVLRTQPKAALLIAALLAAPHWQT